MPRTISIISGPKSLEVSQFSLKWPIDAFAVIENFLTRSTDSGMSNDVSPASESTDIGEMRNSLV
jgi:hypothetical protein